MTRVTTVATLITGLVLLAGCSSSGSESAATTLVKGAATQAASAPGAPAGDGSAGDGSARDGSTEDDSFVVVAPTAGAPTVDGLLARQVWDRTKAKLDSVSSAHVASWIPATAKHRRAQFNFTMSDDGRAFGTMQTGRDNIWVQRVGSVIYAKGNRGFWDEDGSEPKATAKAGRWVKVTRGGPDRLQKFFALTDLDTVLDRALGLTPGQVRSLSLVPGSSMTGAKNVGLANLPANRLTRYPGTLYVAPDGTPLLLRMGPKDKPPYMTFDNWNEPVKFNLPKDAVPLKSLT